MARPRDPRRAEAKRIWLESVGMIKLVDLAQKVGVTSSTIRKWKSNDKWDNELKGSAPKLKGSALKHSRGSPGAPKGNQNAAGNRGGPPTRNDNAVTHGFFRKYLPAQAMSIVEDMDESSLSLLDMLWMSIQTKFAAIIHAQKVMFVESKEEMIKEVKKEKESWGENSGSSETEWEVQFAWDRQATFLNAQSRAMSELRSLIKDFLQLSGQDDMRRLQLEKMQKEIEKTKLEIEKGNNPDKDKPIEVVISRKSKRVGVDDD